MRKTSQVLDVDGKPVRKGDTVTTLNDRMNAKVVDMGVDLDTMFVRLRPVHQSVGQGIWHAADQVQRIALAKK